MKHQLTKTDFIQYLNCSKSLWLLKNKPEDYEKGEMSLFLEKLIAVAETRKSLLEYCKLDTLAMVELYKKLMSIN